MRGKSINLPLDQIFQEWQSGTGLRELAIKYQTPKSTLSDRLRAKRQDYNSQRNHYGILPILQEYLSASSLLTQAQKQIVQDWIDQNKFKLAASNSSTLNLYTTRQIDDFTRAECSHKSKDWRDVLTD